MKTLALATAVALATAGGAFAMTGPVTLDSPADLASNYRVTVLQLVPGADLSNLTTRQVMLIESYLQDVENRTDSAAPGFIRNVLERS